jgi:tRNA (cytidine/uridine-2'-O-)-methyltransferase
VIHIVLFEPEIPPNTGNLIRLCANTGAHLHLIEPLGFSLEEKQLRRSGLDYHDMTRVHTYRDLPDFIARHPCTRLWVIETGGHQRYDQVTYQDGDGLVFGPETRGLKAAQLALLNSPVVSLPMTPNNRSLNLSNCASIVTFEAWRQLGFDGCA